MTKVVPPSERVCEECGRRDVWDDDRWSWTIATDEEGNREAGTPHCLHDWDINGTYSPIDTEN